MKRKGFTLVELLAVIVVLAIISIITIPMIGNVIDESKKRALEVSANGLVEAASYYTINHDGVTEFVFDENKKGETIKGEQLDYKGSIEGTGKLYIDQEGDISLCLVDDKYYVYKNYNSGIYVGEVKNNSCIIGYDVLTNKYVAMLDDGTGQISNVYSKDEVNNLIDNLQSQISDNTNNINSLQTSIDNINSNLNELLYYDEMNVLYEEHFSSTIDKTVQLSDNWANYKFLMFSSGDNGNAGWYNPMIMPTIVIKKWYDVYKGTHLGTYPQITVPNVFISGTATLSTIFIPNGENTFRVITSSGLTGTFKIIGIK